MLASVKHNKLTFVRHKVTEFTWKWLRARHTQTKRCAAQDRLMRMDMQGRLAHHAQVYLIAFPSIYLFGFFPIVTRWIVSRRLLVSVVKIVTFQHNQEAASCVIYKGYRAAKHHVRSWGYVGKVNFLITSHNSSPMWSWRYRALYLVF